MTVTGSLQLPAALLELSGAATMFGYRAPFL
jgi:hypothetical protein